MLLTAEKDNKPRLVTDWLTDLKSVILCCFVLFRPFINRWTDSSSW